MKHFFKIIILVGFLCSCSHIIFSHQPGPEHGVFQRLVQLVKLRLKLRQEALIRAAKEKMKTMRQQKQQQEQRKQQINQSGQAPVEVQIEQSDSETNESSSD